MSLGELSPWTQQQQLRGECRTSPARPSSPLCDGELDYALRSQRLHYEQSLLDLNRRILRLETDKTQLQWTVKQLNNSASTQRGRHFKGVRTHLRKLRTGLAAIREAYTSEAANLTHFFAQSLQCLQELSEERKQRYQSIRIQMKDSYASPQPGPESAPASPRESSSPVPEELQDLRQWASLRRMMENCAALQCLHCGSLLAPAHFHNHILSCRLETIASPRRDKSTEARLRSERNKARLEAERLLLQLKGVKMEWALREERREERDIQHRTLVRRGMRLLQEGDTEGALEQLAAAQKC